jgi:hypothetical protein
MSDYNTLYRTSFRNSSPEHGVTVPSPLHNSSLVTRAARREQKSAIKIQKTELLFG